MTEPEMDIEDMRGNLRAATVALKKINRMQPLNMHDMTALAVVVDDTDELLDEVERLRRERDAVHGQIEQACRLLVLCGDRIAAQIVLAQVERAGEFTKETR